MKREKALDVIRSIYTTDAEKEALQTLIPELKEDSEDERMRKEILAFIRREGQHIDKYKWPKWMAWLEKQKENIEKEYVFRPLAGTDITTAANQAVRRANEGDRLVLAFNGAYIPVKKGCNVNKIVDMYDAFIEKQKINTEGDFGRGYDCGYKAGYAVALDKIKPAEDWKEKRKEECPFRRNLDNNLYGCERYEGLVSECTGACSWVVDYPQLKEIQDKQEQKPEVKLTGWVSRDRNGEVYVYGAYPEKDSEKGIWIESNSILLYRRSFLDLKWEDDPVEVEITIKRG